MSAKLSVVWLLFSSTLSAQPSPELYDVVVESDVKIPARDGTALATDIYHPAVGGVPISEKLPVLLQRTPYGKHGERFVESARFFASHGYVVAFQDMRGRFASGGGRSASTTTST